MQVLVHVSTYQGVHFGTGFLSHSHMVVCVCVSVKIIELHMDRSCFVSLPRILAESSVQVMKPGKYLAMVSIPAPRGAAFQPSSVALKELPGLGKLCRH